VLHHLVCSMRNLLTPLPPRNAVSMLSEAVGLVEASPASSEPEVGLWIYHYVPDDHLFGGIHGHNHTLLVSVLSFNQSWGDPWYPDHHWFWGISQFSCRPGSFDIKRGECSGSWGDGCRGVPKSTHDATQRY